MVAARMGCFLAASFRGAVAENLVMAMRMGWVA